MIKSKEIDEIISTADEHGADTLTANQINKLIDYIRQCEQTIYDQEIHIHTLEFY